MVAMKMKLKCLNAPREGKDMNMNYFNNVSQVSFKHAIDNEMEELLSH